jgi:hypothetical protein
MKYDLSRQPVSALHHNRQIDLTNVIRHTTQITKNQDFKSVLLNIAKTKRSPITPNKVFIKLLKSY